MERIPETYRPEDVDEKAQAERIIRSLFRDEIRQRTGRGQRIGVGDLFWSIRYADRLPSQVVGRYKEIRLIRRYYEEDWFRELAREELEKAARENEDQRELIDLPR